MPDVCGIDAPHIKVFPYHIEHHDAVLFSGIFDILMLPEVFIDYLQDSIVTLQPVERLTEDGPVPLGP